ncbi:MAG: helix-turn-helix domain-containing protein [Clostridia bacterium]|nr:helix-turn-helix domain-containing protein [Clostridia bacterium]
MSIIKELRNRKGLTQAQLAKMCNVHQTAVSQWEKGRTDPDRESLKILSEIFSVPVDTIMGLDSGNDNKVIIPVLGYVRAGTPIEAVEEILDYEEISPQLAATGDFFALQIKGNSMEPRICENDVVIVRKQSDVDSGDVAVVLVNSMDATVKKVIKKGTSLSLVPFNPNYDVMIYSAEEVSRLPVNIIGKVVELRGKF